MAKRRTTTGKPTRRPREETYFTDVKHALRDWERKNNKPNPEKNQP